MQSISIELATTVTNAYDKLTQISEADNAQALAPGKWSPKQIIGHLLDSASNNHQRFVRVQQADGLSLPGYAQEFWVSSQNYQAEAWGDLLAFWKSYNLHLAHVIASIPVEKLSHTVRVGNDEPVTLHFLLEDYVAHLKLHLQQIFRQP